MSHKSKMRIVLIVLIITALSHSGFSQELTNERAKWFIDARYGMFIHWGVYSGAEGVWKGEKHRDGNNYAEWIQYRNRIDQKEYLTLLDRFKWELIDPEKWVILAKNAGMKYIVITAKHHDGFALWDSKASSYNVAEYTTPKRDIIKELAAACQKHGLKLGLYYSHWIDWEHSYGWDHTKELTGLSKENYDRYWQEKVIPQMRELLTGYGPISIIWFDMWVHYTETVVSKEQLLQLKGLIRELQPGCLINSRLGLSLQEDRDVDFEELGDNQLGNMSRNFPWQSPATVADSWGFNRLDTEWKSTTALLHSLICNVSLNGNFLLNIGPRANGDVPYEISQRLLEIGNWLKINGESIYGCGAFTLPKDQHDWGKITFKKTDSGANLYLHIFNYPLNNQLDLTGISTKPSKVYLLYDKNKAPLSFTYNIALTTIKLPATSPDHYVPVVVVEYPLKPEITEGLVAKNMEGGYSLTPFNLPVPVKDLKISDGERSGTIPAHCTISKKTAFRWKIFVDRPGTKVIDVSYSYQGVKSGNLMVLKAAQKTINHTVLTTGKTVVEPNENYIVDNYKSNRLGAIDFPAAGFYDIVLEIDPEENVELNFQWLWLN
jgi:alpha-L-fucosidase